MSSEPTARHAPPGHDADATRRQRFGLVLAVVLGLDRRRDLLLRDEGRLGGGRPASRPPRSWRRRAWRRTRPGISSCREGPHRDEFQTSCLICHSARLPFGQPPFGREKWAEIVHKMVAVYGAPDDHRGRVPCRGLLARRPAACARDRAALALRT